MKINYFILLTIFLIGCKTPKKITTDSETHVRETKSSELLMVNTDSVVKRVLTTIDLEFDYTVIKWSKPDSTGKQYKEEEHSLTGKGKKQEKSSTEANSTAITQRKDSTDLNIGQKVKTVTVEQKTFWQKFKDRILVVLLIVAGIAVWIIKKKMK